MKKAFLCIGFAIYSITSVAQTVYDSSSRVDTVNQSTSTVNSTNTNNNLNVNTTTVNSVNTNENVNTSTSVNTNNGHTTSDNKNTNINASVNQNTNVSTSVSNQSSTSVNRNDNYSSSDVNQKIVQPPPTAIAPSMMSGGNADLCTVGVSGAVQTQILGISAGKTQRDLNCERLKLSKTMYDMGMKVAAVSILCQDRRVFDAMLSAGTPCPYDGKIGETAKQLWESNPDRIPPVDKDKGNASSFGITTIVTDLLSRLFQ
jgi:hypothetical protein